MNDKPIHLTGLNGLRAIAAISVLLSHVFQDTFGNWGIPGMTIPIFGGGVTLFFVISGFLITYLLLKEIAVSNTVNIKSFYIRRVLRIWPLYYGYLILALLLLLFLGLGNEIINPNLWFYMFFSANIPFFAGSGIWIIVHYWSIGVEEQFYLFWPWLAKFTKQKVLYGALAVMILWLALKYGSWIVFSNKSLIYKFFTVTSFQSMMYGAVGAIFFYNKNKIFLRITTNRFTQIATWIFFIFAWFLDKHIPAILQNDVIAFFSLFLIMEQVGAKSKMINMENRFFDFIGKISYGIYVIHPMVIFILSYFWRTLHPTFDLKFQYVCIYVLTASITILLAHLSYTYYEKPFLKMKDKFSVIKSNNSIIQ